MVRGRVDIAIGQAERGREGNVKSKEISMA
jgi:hypothetical protein